MSVPWDRRLRWLSVVVALVLLAGVGVAGAGTVAVLSAVASVAAGESVLLAVLQAAVPFLLAFAVLSVLGVALLTWLVVRTVRLAEVPRSGRLEAVARGVERQVPGVEAGTVSERVAPTVADRRDALVERYADGDLTEREFERELEALLDEHDDAATDWSATDSDGAFDREFADELDLDEPGREGSSSLDPDRDDPSAFERERR
jgi:hypothetical protein